MPVHIRTPGLVLTEHEFSVPLDHAAPGGERITVFAREVADPDGRDRPFLVYLQGGPGSEAPRPTRRPTAPAWLDRALQEFRVLMLDQRGTGRSTPVGQLPGRTPQQQADYLAHFRADAIVRDAEWIRTELGVDRWSVLGQSFGGFCVTTYLSIAPEGLREAFLTGGLPPLGRPVDDVYRATYERVLERNRRYYERYPADRERVRELRLRIDAGDVRLPGGDRLTGPRVRQLGDRPGDEHRRGAPAQPARAAARLARVPARRRGGGPVRAQSALRGHPRGLLRRRQRTRWSAQRLLPQAYEDPTLFTGEHVYPWMFSDYAALAPLREAADLLAQREWPRLYDPGQLRRNEVPVAAIAYAEDMYVERTFSEETAREVRGLRLWLTNEYDHDGLRADGERILGRLIDLARDL